MKSYVRLAVVLTLGLLVLATFATVVLADQKSNEKSSEGKTVAKAPPSDEVSGILGHYFAMRDLLAHDKTEGVAQQAKEMTRRLDGLIKGLQAIRTASDDLKTDDLKRAREDFGPLSEAALSYVQEFGFSGEAYGFYCDMVKKSWLQEHDQIGNPYYGSEMFKCGEMTGKVQNGRFIEATQGKSGMRIYEVFGMNCPGCHGAVEKLVKKIPAVDEVEANWKEQRLTVTVRPGSELNDEDIYDAVRRANFTPGKRKQ
jgi:copper chaperone CopZ